MEIEYCKKCVTPNTRPRIRFDNEGICNACKYSEYKYNIDWVQRKEELNQIVESNRNNGSYDCIIPISGGKDSHYQVYYVTKILGLNPLCVTFSPAIPTEEGIKNIRNIVDKLNVDHIQITPNPLVHRKLSKIMFEKYGDPFVPWVQGIYSAVTKVAVEKDINLIIYGENGELEYGGNHNYKQLDKKGVEVRVKSNKIGWKNPENWDDFGIEKKYLDPYIESNKIEKKGVKRIFLGDFVSWNGNKNLYYSLNVIGGFTTSKKRTTGTYTYGSSFDDKLDELYLYMLWIKYGFGRATKSASPDIREGKLSRDSAINLIKKYDGEFPSDVFNEILDYLNLSKIDFCNIIRKFVGDDENLNREEIMAKSNRLDYLKRIPSWKKINNQKWKHIKTIHGEDRFLELPF